MVGGVEILTIMSSFKGTQAMILSGCVSQTYLFTKLRQVNFFFKKYEREKADFLAVNVEKKEKNWHWYRHSSIISPKVYGCFFALPGFHQLQYAS